MSKVDGTSKGGGGDGDSIQVFVRVRPPGRQEGDLDLGACVSVDTANNALILKAKPDPKVFTFDQVADVKTTQETVFSAVAKKLIDKCVSGYNGTIFAYGQTGSGKTFTMVGPSEDENNFQHELRGVIPRSFEYLFGLINRQKELLGDRIQYLCRASFLEIYNEQLSDLLDAGAASPQLRENIKRGVIVEGLTEKTVNTASDAYGVLQDGWKNRRVAETAMNHESSRSHAVFTLHIESKENKQGTWQVRASRLNLVDLAGSERQKDTKTTGSRLKEGCSINKSLSALGNVIMSLVQSSHETKPRYIPYRDSKLTFLLRDSLGGNAKTHIIACIHPGNKFFGETLSTLQFARRAKQIKNKAVVNEDIHGDMPALRAELTRLKEDLAVKDKLLEEIKASGPGVVCTAPSTGPWRERFMDAMRVCEGLKVSIKLKDQKQTILEAQITQKEKKILQLNMVLRFRTDAINKLEGQLKKKNPDSTPDDVIPSLRGEIKSLEEIVAGRHEAQDAVRARLQREVATLRQQLEARDMGEERLMAAYEEAMASKDLRPQLITPKQAEGEQATGTAERQKSQIAKLQGEMETVKRCHSVEMETLKKKLMDMESELASAQAVKAELEKTLEMTQQRCTIQRETQEKMHMDTIKTITTPKRVQYQLRNRRVMSEGMNTPDQGSVTQEEDGLQEETMPDVMYQEQIEGLTNQITNLRQENSNISKKLQEYDTKFLDLVHEKSGLQSRNTSLQEKMTEYEETARQHDDRMRQLQQELFPAQESQRLAEDELQDLRILAAQTEKHKRETREERDSLKKDNTTLESKVLSLEYQLEESVRQNDDITVSLNTAQEDMENLQSELEYLVSQQKELESLLQTEKGEHAQTRAYLQTVQTRLDNETSSIEQLKDQMHQQGSEKEEEVISLMEAKRAVQGQLEARTGEVTALQDKVDTLTQQASTAQDLLRQQERAKKDLEAAMLTLSEERNHLRQELRTINSERDDLLSQLNDLTSRHAEDASEHESQLSTLKEEYQNGAAALRQQLEDRCHEASALQAQYDLQQEDMNELMAMNEELVTRNTALEAEKTQAQVEIDQLNDLKAKLSNQITDLDSKVVQLEEKLLGQQQMYEARLKEQTADDDLIDNLQTERNDLYRNNIEKEQDLRSAREDIMLLSEQINEVEQKISLERKASEKAREEAEAAVSGKDKEIQTWRQIAETEQKLTEQLARRQSELELLMSQKDINLANLHIQIQMNKVEIETARNLQSKVETQTREVALLQQDITDKDDQITRMRTVAENDQENISQITSQVAELQEVNTQLREEITEVRVELERSLADNARIAGHNNIKQKIHYVEQLKEQLRKLTDENKHKDIRILQLEGKQRAHNGTGLPGTPARGADHRPGNGTPGHKGTPGNKGTPGHKGTPGQRKPVAYDKPLVEKENTAPTES